MIKTMMLITLILILGGCDTKKRAKEDLEQKGIQYTQQNFAKSLESNNTEVVDLFLKAGIDMNNEEIIRGLVNSSDMGIIKKALEAGLNPNLKSNGVPLIVLLVQNSKNNLKLNPNYAITKS